MRIEKKKYLAEQIMVRWIGKRLAQRLKIGVQLFEFDLHIAPELTAFFQTTVSVDSWKIGTCRNAELMLLKQCFDACLH